MEAIEFCQDSCERVLRFKPEGFAILVFVANARAGIATAGNGAGDCTELVVFPDVLRRFLGGASF